MYKPALLLLLFLQTLCHAQEYSPFTRIHGAGSNVVHYVFQDSKGYMWFATNEGVSRYNGYEFTHITRDDGLSDHDVFEIYEDKKKRLWFLTYSGEPTIYDNGEIKTAENTGFLSTVRPGSMAIAISESNDSLLYVTKKIAYLFVNDVLMLTINSNDDTVFLRANINSEKISMLCNYGMVHFNHGNTHHFPDHVSLHISSTSFNHIQVNNELYYCYNKNNKYYFEKYNVLTSRITELYSKSPDTIKTIFYNQLDTSVGILTNSRVYKYYIGQNKLDTICHHDIPYAIYCTFDNNSNIWITSVNEGIFFSQLSPVRTFKYTTTSNTKSAYSLGMHKGCVYGGYNNNEIFKWDGRKASFSTVGSRNELAPIYSFHSADNMLYAVSAKFIFDVENIKKIDYSAYYAVKALEITDKYVFVAIVNKLYRCAKNSFNRVLKIPFPIFDSVIYDRRVTSMRFIEDDGLYIGTLNGLKLLQDDQLVPIKQSKLQVFNSYVSRIITDEKDNVIFSTLDKGIGVLSGDTSYVLNKYSGLVSNNCKSIFLDIQGRLWVATNKGLNKVVFSSDGFQVDEINCYTTSNGLPSNNINDVLVKGDTVWLATDNGICYFIEPRINFRYPAPILRFENFAINSISYSIEDKITVPHDSNNIAIDFIGLSYYLRDTVRYRYKLKPFDDNWKYTYSRHIEYPELPPGNYTFLVASTNAGDNWNENQQEIRFEITYPFWKTWWFMTLVVLLLLVIILLILRFIARSLRRKHELQNKSLQFQKEKVEYENELLELEQKALNLQMNPHFIFNAINAIKGFYAIDDIDAAYSYIDKFAELMRMILEKNSRNTLALHEEIKMLTAYLELAALQKDVKFDYSITVDESINTWNLQIPPMIVQPFVENAIIHGIGSITKGGRITIRFSLMEKFMKCEIEDNGIGREASSELNLNKLRKSKGIEITKKRLWLLSEESSIHIHDVTTEDNRVVGTKVVILLPLHSA